jgi:hypothetical protein
VIGGASAAAGSFTDVVAASLDISGDIDVDGTTNLDVVDIDGAVDMASTLKVDTRVGIGVAAHSSAALAIATTDQHIRLSNGSELGVIELDSDGELNIWAHGDGEVINLRTGSGAGTDIVKVNSTGIDVTGTAVMDGLTVDGNVGIGTDSPSAPKFSSTPDGVLNLSGNKPVVYLTEEDETDSNVWMGLSNEIGIIGNTGDGIAFRTGSSTATEKARIDSSGNLLVGKSDSDTLGTAGHELHNSGMVHHTRATGTVQYLNRTGNDGTIADFRKDGTAVGSIASEGGDSLVIQSGTTSGSGLLFHPTVASIAPVRNSVKIDATIDLGRSGFRFKDLYLSGGVYLGGTGSANKLDDYEEGTFSGTQAGSVYSGTYTKIGRICHISITIDNSSSTGTSMAILPFSAKNGGTAFNGTQPTYNTSSSLNDTYIAIYNGGNTLFLYSKSGATQNVTTGTIEANWVYETD